MKTSSYTLLPITTFGTVSENYDGIVTTFSGNPVKAASYYTKAKSMQTISWHASEFIGYMKLEATLDEDMNSNNYFPIGEIGDGITPLTESNFANFTGKYTWIRVTITNFAAGSINKVSIGY